MNYVIALFGIAIGIACFWASFKLIRKFLQVRKWLRVEATVVSKEIFLRPNYSTSRSPYGIKITYDYFLLGKKYSGNKLTLTELIGGQVNYMKKNAEVKLKKIPATLQIFVNPDNPEEAVAYCSSLAFYVVIFLMGVLSCILGLSSLITAS